MKTHMHPTADSHVIYEYEFIHNSRYEGGGASADRASGPARRFAGAPAAIGAPKRLKTWSDWRGLDISTRFAGAKGFVGIELHRNISQIQQDISFTPQQLVELGIAPLAIPGVAFRFFDSPHSLHNQPDCIRRPLW